MVKEKRVKRAFSSEYKAQAVALVLQEGRRQSDVARSLGIGGSLLSKWCREARTATAGPSAAESSRIKELERENRQLKQEREILKKAAAYFAKNQ